jgi:hypothetical protein
MNSAVQTYGKCLCHKHDDIELEILEQPNITQLSQHLIISTGEARKILGTEALDVSDEELEEFIFATTSISQRVLQLAVQNNPNGT